jgi:hypothetical protein
VDHGRHAVAGNEQSAEDELREDERRHELHGLELGGRERRKEESKRDAEQRVAEREQDDEPDGPRDVEPECYEGDGGANQGLLSLASGPGESNALPAPSDGFPNFGGSLCANDQGGLKM